MVVVGRARRGEVRGEGGEAAPLQAGEREGSQGGGHGGGARALQPTRCAVHGGGVQADDGAQIAAQRVQRVRHLRVGVCVLGLGFGFEDGGAQPREVQTRAAPQAPWMSSGGPLAERGGGISG